MHNLIEYSDNYSKNSGSLWQYYKDEPFLDNNGDIDDFPADNNNRAPKKQQKLFYIFHKKLLMTQYNILKVKLSNLQLTK